MWRCRQIEVWSRIDGPSTMNHRHQNIYKEELVRKLPPTKIYRNKYLLVSEVLIFFVLLPVRSIPHLYVFIVIIIVRSVILCGRDDQYGKQPIYRCNLQDHT